MPQNQDKPASPLSVRLTKEERADLTARAGTLTLSEYVKRRLFGDDAPTKLPSSMLADRNLLAQLLATLGGSDVAASLYRLARAADSGSLPVDEDIVRRLRVACDDVRLMHNALMKGLGKETREPSDRERIASAAFRTAAGDPEEQP